MVGLVTGRALCSPSVDCRMRGVASIEPHERVDSNLRTADLPANLAPGRQARGLPAMKDVKGKVAFITGGASGIGLGMAKAFVNAGMNVVLADIRRDHIDESLAHFRGTGQAGQVHALKLDVTDRAAFAAAADET